MLGDRKLLERVWAVGLLCLIAFTWRLWTPLEDAMQVPVVDGLASIPVLVSWLPMLMLIAASGLIVNTGDRRLWWLVAGCLLAAFLMNQHRLQPWAYQTAIYAVVFASMDRESTRRWLRPLAASIYIYSAMGKFDFQFAHTVGQQFLESAMRLAGGIPESWTESTRAKLTMLFPAGELLIGITLLIPRLRRMGGCLAIAFHLTLLVVLGPWGLDHSTGVLMWNALLMIQAYLLFVSVELSLSADLSRSAKTGACLGTAADSRISLVAKAIVMMAIVAPIGERHGYWDHWLSWALYSPHSSRVRVEVHESGITNIDSSIRDFFSTADAENPWRTLAMDRWSLQELGVPVYPQARFQLAVAERLSREHQLGDAIRVIVRGSSDRWTGERTEQRLISEKEVRQSLGDYWFVGR